MNERIDFDKIPEADLILKGIKNRNKQGLNSNVFIIGLSGTGKSSTSLRLAEKIQKQRLEDTGIEHKIYICDSLLELLRAVRGSKTEGIVIIEEVSVLFGSRRAMAGENVAIGKVLDTCRKRRLTIISNAPIWTSIDAHMKAMGNFLVETLRINTREKVVISKFFRLQPNPSSGKVYTHRMQRHGLDVSRMFTRMPDQELWDAYEKQKDIFMDKLYQKLEVEQLVKEKKANKLIDKPQPIIKQLTERELQVHDLCNRQELTQYKCAEMLGLSQGRINQILKNINQKSQNAKENSTNTLMKDTAGAFK